MRKIVSLFALGFILAAPAASALTQAQARECRMLAETLGPAKAALQVRVAERDALAAEAEAAGEAWENAENVRTLGEDAAAQADSLRVTFDEKKAAFELVEAELFEHSQKLNANFNRFNNLCVTE